jgi:hypothetical protein
MVDGTLLIEENTLSRPRSRMGMGGSVLQTISLSRRSSLPRGRFSLWRGRIRASVLGFERQRMIQTAVKRVLVTVALEKFNCLETDHITMRSFCGMPFVTVLGTPVTFRRERAFWKRKSLDMMTGTPNQIELAEQIRSSTNAEFDRVAKAFRAVAGKQAGQDRIDTCAIIRILEEKRKEVMAIGQAGYFIHTWRELTDQVRQMIGHDDPYRAIKANRKAHRNTGGAESSLVQPGQYETDYGREARRAWKERKIRTIF